MDEKKIMDLDFKAQLKLKPLMSTGRLHARS